MLCFQFISSMFPVHESQRNKRGAMLMFAVRVWRPCAHCVPDRVRDCGSNQVEHAHHGGDQADGNQQNPGDASAVSGVQW